MTESNQSKRVRIASWKIALRAGLVILLVASLAITGRWLYWRIHHVTTDAAYVKADMANVAPEVPGKIMAICIKEGQTVKKGDVLLRIDPEQMDRQVALSDADLSGLLTVKERFAAEVEQVRKTIPASIAAARAATDVAERQKTKAQTNFDHWTLMQRRYQELYGKQSIGKAKFEEVETAWRAAEADLHAATAQIHLAHARLKEAEASRAIVKKAEASYREVDNHITKAREAAEIAKLTRSRCDMKAPIDGVIARLLAREGDFATPGRPVMGLYNPQSRYIEARFEETKVRYIHPGKKVHFTVDNYPGRELTGKVLFITPASAAEFALIPRDVSAGEFTKVVQRIPIRIAIDDLEKLPELMPGMSCEIAIARD